jgi:hypothetical protein
VGSLLGYGVDSGWITAQPEFETRRCPRGSFRIADPRGIYWDTGALGGPSTNGDNMPWESDPVQRGNLGVGSLARELWKRNELCPILAAEQIVWASAFHSMPVRFAHGMSLGVGRFVTGRDSLGGVLLHVGEHCQAFVTADGGMF